MITKLWASLLKARKRLYSKTNKREVGAIIKSRYLKYSFNAKEHILVGVVWDRKDTPLTKTRTDASKHTVTYMTYIII